MNRSAGILKAYLIRIAIFFLVSAAIVAGLVSFIRGIKS